MESMQMISAKTITTIKPFHFLPPQRRCSFFFLPQPAITFISGGRKRRFPGWIPCNVGSKRLISSTAQNKFSKEDDENAVERLRNKIYEIKLMLTKMGDGEINISAYDTAWVALVKRRNDDDTISGEKTAAVPVPQFPSSLQWIIDNQLPDGSWGDAQHYTAHDRLINTLACIIALKTWDVCLHKYKRGLKYMQENMDRLEEEDAEQMPIGFEITFPSLLDIARTLRLDLPYATGALQQIYTMRSFKINRIPKDVVHQMPTTLLHSLEGIPGLEWEKLIKLQSSDGSFLFSPASTAYALMQTKDDKCLLYLEKIVKRFNGGVPNVYPVDMFEHIWAVDKLQRLGISRYMEAEIKECLDYVYKYWSDDGICWARNTTLQDVDDTAMAFRLLRLHGYDVSSDVFKKFYKDGEFFCFAGQSTQAVTGMYNLNRASQIQFPGESILQEARDFTYIYLREKQSANQLLDKWIITKDLPGEVEYGLEFPWSASLPRVEARIFLDQYGGDKDVWIGKTLYRMMYVNNDVYLQASKSDFNRCQALHRKEWLALPTWLDQTGLKAIGVTEEQLLRAYFLATSNIFEPERSLERLAWTRTMVLVEQLVVISNFNNDNRFSNEAKQLFVEQLQNLHKIRSGWNNKSDNNIFARAIHHTINLIEPHNIDIQKQLRQAWVDWVMTLPNKDHDGGALLMVRTLESCAGRTLSNNDERLADLTSSACSLLRKQRASDQNINQNQRELVESQMREIMYCVLKNGSVFHRNSKNTFLTVTKTFYYVAHCPPATMETHISRVLFRKLV